MAKNKKNPSPVTQDPSAFDRALLAWRAPRYLRYERSWLWFVLLFVICGGLALYGYETDSLTMAIVFVLLPFVLVLEHRKKPDMVEVVISEYGIRFGEMRLPYSNIQNFWILHNPPFVNELHLETDNRSHKEFVIQLMNVDPTSLRQFLVTQILEREGKTLSFTEALIRILRLN